MNELDGIMAFEAGELSQDSILELFSMLIKNGHAWTLQGYYGRTARSLIEGGWLTKDGELTGKQL